ncbi:MAG: hypothetical protein SNJ82_05615 [Gemmataceae bacterium]
MARSLPTAEIVRKYLDDHFDSHSPVMVLRWPADEELAERLWDLPDGLCLAGSAPRRLGYVIRRTHDDLYSVRLVWNRTVLSWNAVSRMDLLASCLGSLLAAIGVDLWSVLEQPLPSKHSRPRAA